MKKNIVLISLLLASFLSACTLGSLSPEEAEGTAYSQALTIVPLTLAAMPTNTALPTSTQQPSYTPTLEPTSTLTEIATVTVTVPTFAPTWTPYGQNDPAAAATAKADKADFNAPLLLDNQSGEEIHLTILSPIYQEYEFTKSMTLILPEGSFTFRAKVGVNSYSGSFAITNGDKHVLSFYTNKYHFSTP